MASGIASGNKPTGVVDLDSSQTLENKTLDSTNTLDGSSIENPSRLDVKQDTQANLETYALTATNGQLCFATDTKLMYQVVDNALTPVGSGSGGINYIENSDFEIDADGWTGDTNLTIARSTSSPLRGDASGVVSKGAVDASGEVISIPFTIDSADLAKKLYISADVDASDANYADGDLRWKIVKDPNGTPVTIRPNAEDILGGNFSRLAWFQSDATITEYELQIECNSVNASAYSVKIDNISVGPREASYGSAMTDWKSYTPTTQGLGTITVNSSMYRRVGDSIEVRGKLTLGTTSAVQVRIGLPQGVSALSSLVNEDSGLLQRAASTDNQYPIIISGGDDYVRITRRGSASSNLYTGLLGSSMFGSGESISYRFRVPIQGWSSNSLMSEDIGNREIYVSGGVSSGVNIPHNVTTKITNLEVDDDTANILDSVNNKLIIPESGYYSLDFFCTITISSNNGRQAYSSIRVNGTQVKFGNRIDASASNIFRTIASNTSIASIKLEKGDEIEFYMYQNNNSGSTYSTGSARDGVQFTLKKLAQPQTLLETETVAARYTSDSGQAFVSGGTTINFEDIDFDTHNGMSSGVYTVPVKGKYQVSYNLTTAGASFSATTGLISRILVNSTAKTEAVTYGNGSTIALNTRESTTLDLEKGDTVEIQAAGLSDNLNSGGVAGNKNYFSIARIK